MLFDLFKRKKKDTVVDIALSEDDEKWNKMWDMWVDGEIPSPYSELMTYQSEINNGGHSQYFLNIENTEDVSKALESLNGILSQVHKDNLETAYKASLLLKQDEENEKAEDKLNECDNVFYENEEEINCILKAFCNDL